MSQKERARRRLDRLTVETQGEFPRAYREAVRAGVPDPVVMMLDLADPFARAVAEATQPALAAEARAGTAGRGLDPLVALGLPRDEAAALVAAGSSGPAGRACLAAAVPGCFLTVLISGGTIRYLFVPLPEGGRP